ncbi:MAG TPA: hypothetical protein VI159_06915 [Gemmatimonadales bacterium]
MGDSGNLQFDRAESATAGARSSACILCKKPLTTTYFDVNGKMICPDCRTSLDARLNAGTSTGRFAKALALGAGAAVVGAGIYYAIAALTGAEWGIVAIVVGLLVGKAVRKGSNGRGGWRYQALAMTLTYCAIVATYAPPVFTALRDQARQENHSTGLSASGSDTTAAATPKPSPAVGAGTVLLGLTLLAGLILAAPILTAIQSPLEFIIIAIALYEAWKINQRPRYTITGPYAVATPTAGTA